MKREIEILKEGKYRGISGDQTRGPVEFRFDMMVDGKARRRRVAIAVATTKYISCGKSCLRKPTTSGTPKGEF